MGLFFKAFRRSTHLLVGEAPSWFVRFAEGASPKVALDAELESDRAQLDARLREGAARWAPADRLVQARPLERHARLHHHAAAQRHRCVCGHAGACVQPRHTPPGPDHAALTALGQPCPELDLVYFFKTRPSFMSSQNLSIRPDRRSGAHHAHAAGDSQRLQRRSHCRDHGRLCGRGQPRRCARRGVGGRRPLHSVPVPTLN